MTAREAETLELMAQGHANAAIARALGVTHATVAKHINNIFVKLDLQQSADHHRRVVAVLTFLDHRNDET